MNNVTDFIKGTRRGCGWRSFLTLIPIALLVSACRHDTPASAGTKAEGGPNGVAVESAAAGGACEIVLAPPASDGRIEREITRVQARIRAGREEFQSVERLGWLYVAKARESFDAGYYKLAEQCALCLEARRAQAPEALLLRGHVLQNLHRFKEAEPLARELVTRRGLSFDYGLLGDVLMEQGRLDEAAMAYQTMVDQRPDLEAYARIAHLRWLKGDLTGSTEVMRLATSAASPRAPEPAAWVNTRLGFLRFQAGRIEEAKRICDVALDFQPEYAPALLLKGRLLLAESLDSVWSTNWNPGPEPLTSALSRREREAHRNIEAAVETLQRAARLNPLPEYLWVLSEALRTAGRDSDAKAVEAKLNREGAVNDPRTFSLYLSSRGQSLSKALELARSELNTRQDVFTHDALAWALSANGQNGEALKETEQALAQGTQETRLFFHAAVIATRAGQAELARQWLDKVARMTPLLLPLERKQLLEAATTIGRPQIPSQATARPAGLAETTLFTPGS